MTEESQIYPLGGRFRGFLPVVIDLETGGFNQRGISGTQRSI